MLLPPNSADIGQDPYNAPVRRRLNQYIITEILGPLGLGFLVYTFILLIRFLFQSAEMIIRRGLPVSIVGKLLLLTLPNIVVLTLPMSLLFGTLIAVGRLSSDSELIAMRACGVSLLTLYRPIFLLSGLATLLNMALMIYVLPWGNHALQELRLEITTQSVAQQIEPRVFYEEWEGKVVYVFEVPQGSKRWKGVFLAESLPSSANNQITTADWGEVLVDKAGERVVLRLYNAVRHKVDLNAPDRYEVSRHKRLDLILDDQFATEQRAKLSISKGIREMTLKELAQQRDDPASSAEQRNLAQVEIHKKFSIPVACLVFGLFALPLGINNRRGGKASGFALSIGVLILYYILLNNGEEYARFGKMPPWLGMWLPNILLAVAGFFLLVRRNRDKSLLVSRIDRWVRQDVWSAIQRLRGLTLARRKERQEKRAERAREREAAEQARRETSSRKVVLLLPRPRIVFPNILDRYVVRLFTMIFSLVVLSGISLFVIFDLSENIDDILKNKVGTTIVLNYYKYLSLQMFYDIAPIIVLVTTLMTFSLLARTNEITACKALGLSLYRLAIPALAAALLVASFSGYLESSVLPASNEKVAKLKDQIRGKPTARTYRRADHQWLFGQGRYIYNYLHYDPRQPSLQRLQVFDFDTRHRLTRRLYTDNAQYIGGGWLFNDGWVRAFDGVEVTGYKRFQKPMVEAHFETPDYFDSEIRPPDQMRYGELKDYIQELKESGQPVPELQIELENKIAFPIVSLIMALVALPFSFRLGRQGALYGIGISVVLGMVFMAIFAFFIKMGAAGALPPLVAVWSPGAVFSLLSGYLFLGVKT
ncbi:MAG TPA: LPS export ABC transporter permease LptF [Thermoanaerobaculia bacterium]|jgi:LPS export ABC transporter permease LptF/LPS export ABC transporter permease LptG|nr:LPS export ABC transporter permease LptF [Thermoanaerobaculia bacterium]